MTSDIVLHSYLRNRSSLICSKKSSSSYFMLITSNDMKLSIYIESGEGKGVLEWINNVERELILPQLGISKYSYSEFVGFK